MTQYERQFRQSEQALELAERINRPPEICGLCGHLEPVDENGEFRYPCPRDKKQRKEN